MSISYPNIATYRSKSPAPLVADVPSPSVLTQNGVDEKRGGRDLDGGDEVDQRLENGLGVELALKNHGSVGRSIALPL